MAEAGCEPLIRVRGLDVGFEERLVLRGVDLDVPRAGLVAVMGPGGVGKTTLLRTLGRWNDLLPSYRASGRVVLDDLDLLHMPDVETAHRLVPLLAQKARLYTATVLDNAIAEIRPDRPLTRADMHDLARLALARLGLWEAYAPVLNEPVLGLPLGRQRMLSIARLTAAGAVCLLADEPLRDLPDDQVEEVEGLIRRLAERQAVVMVTHNQREAQRLSRLVCLVTAGRLVEATPTGEFFAAPRSALGREFVRSGNCWPVAPSEAAGSIETELRPLRAGWPGGFHWILRGTLGGMQWPGLLCDEQQDLEALASLGVRVLVSLTEQRFEPARLARFGIRGEHFPILDMDVPSLEDALRLCESASRHIEVGHPVALHCRAGLGRTGTMLACILAYRGSDAVRAIHQVRSINPRYIQSERQLRFLGEFTGYLAAVSAANPG
jgi:atypical dual specificity phosphatase